MCQALLQVFMCINILMQPSWVEAIIIIPMLHLRKMMPREFQYLPHRHNRCQRRDSHTSLSAQLCTSVRISGKRWLLKLQANQIAFLKGQYGSKVENGPVLEHLSHSAVLSYFLPCLPWLDDELVEGGDSVVQGVAQCQRIADS